MASAKISRPIHVGDVLTAAVPGLRDRMLEESIRSGWRDTVGHDLARRSRPGEVRTGVLNIIVDNSPWLHEMTLRSDALLGALKSRHGAAVTSLRFSLGEAPAPRPPATRHRPSPPARLSAEEEHSIETIAASVADPALAASLRRLMTKDLIARRRHGAPPAARREDT
jgi:hypothetical protein